jgi:hypothetical protein
MNSFKRNIYKSSEDVAEDVIEFTEFDYMVVRFNYTAPYNGTDLDLMIYYENTGVVGVDGNAVGFNQGTLDDIKVPTNSIPDNDAYLWWASDDNYTPGVEAVVIGVKNLVNNETIVNRYLDIRLLAGWFQAFGTAIDGTAGDVLVTLNTYLGGSISKVGTNIVHSSQTGGAGSDVTPIGNSKMVNISSGLSLVTLGHSTDVGTIRYDTLTGQAVLI